MYSNIEDNILLLNTFEVAGASQKLSILYLKPYWLVFEISKKISRLGTQIDPTPLLVCIAGSKQQQYCQNSK